MTVKREKLMAALIRINPDTPLLLKHRQSIGTILNMTALNLWLIKAPESEDTEFIRACIIEMDTTGTLTD